MKKVQFSSVTQSCLTLKPHWLQHARPPCPSPTLGAYSNSCPWVSVAIQPSHPLLSTSPPTFNLSQHQGLFQWVSPLHQVAKVLEFQLQQSVLPINIQDWFPLRWTALIPFSPRDSQEFSPTPQFKSINSSALSFLYTPTLTSIHDYWKNHTFD